MWRPRQKQQEILDRGWYWKESVPYEVSSRWIFYKLYDKDHLFGDMVARVARSTLIRFENNPKKYAYHNLFMPLFSKARKEFSGNWRPDSLPDDSREEVLAGFGYTDEKEWLEIGIGERQCILDKWQDAENYVEILFEAFAMKGQFEYFAPNISLVPFKGDASIEYKWRIAKRLERMAKRYDGKPIKILYFGDLDKKGLEIPESALRDIREWCSVSFEYIRCGLNPGDEVRFGLGSAIDKPNSYQWESLSHEQARELIEPVVNKFVSQRLIAQIEEREWEATKRFREVIKKLWEQKKQIEGGLNKKEGEVRE